MTARTVCTACALPIRPGLFGWYHYPHLPVTIHRARPDKDNPR